MFNLFNSNRSLTYNAAIKLVYDNNIHTLRSRIKVLIVDDEEFDIVQILRERMGDIGHSGCDGTADPLLHIFRGITDRLAHL